MAAATSWASWSWWRWRWRWRRRWLGLIVQPPPAGCVSAVGAETANFQRLAVVILVKAAQEEEAAFGVVEGKGATAFRQSKHDASIGIRAVNVDLRGASPSGPARATPKLRGGSAARQTRECPAREVAAATEAVVATVATVAGSGAAAAAAMAVDLAEAETAIGQVIQSSATPEAIAVTMVLVSRIGIGIVITCSARDKPGPNACIHVGVHKVVAPIIVQLGVVVAVDFVGDARRVFCTPVCTRRAPRLKFHPY